jgi:hypothetical protein
MAIYTENLKPSIPYLFLCPNLIVTKKETNDFLHISCNS